MIQICHNSHSLFFRSPFGAVPCQAKIDLALEVNANEPVEAVTLRLWKYGRVEEKIAMPLVEWSGKKKVYRTGITAPETPGWLWYFFIVEAAGKTCYYGNNERNLGGFGQVYDHEPPSFQVTVYAGDTATPDWFKDSVMYQIFVDRFCNGYEEGKILNPKQHCRIYQHWDDTPVYGTDPQTGKTVCYDCFGGNLLGVIKKLPYLKELGVNVIYLNPIFESSSNHKYDTGDYKKIDPMFGDNQTFQELCRKAGEMGMAIILDGVFSHTGSDSIYFNKEGHYPGTGAYQSPDSPYYAWYRFKSYPEVYDCWWNIETLPNVNETEPSYQQFIIEKEDSVIKHWMKLGAKGWRLDVVDELPESFVKKIRRAMKQMDPSSVLIGEVWEDASNKVSYGQIREYLLGRELDSVMNYPFRRIWLDYILGQKDARETHLSLMSLYENYPRQHFYACMNLIGSHDVERALTILGEAPPEQQLTKEEQARVQLAGEQRRLGLARLKLLTLAQMTFPGVPCIYYGDEAGMEGYRDPLNRGTYPWGKEDQELLGWYKKIIRWRHRYDVLKTGQWIPLYAREQVYGYLRVIQQGKDVFNRVKRNQVAVVLFNPDVRGGYTLDLDLSRWYQGANLVDLLQAGQQILTLQGKVSVSLGPLEGKLLVGGENNEL